MTPIRLLSIVLFFSGILFLSSCATVSGFHIGKVVEKEKGEVGLSLNLARTPDFTLENEDFPNIFVPVFELGGRYGVADKIDIGLRVNTSLNFLIDGKFQIVGDQESEFAMAVGAGFGGFGVLVSSGALLNFQIPIYTSFHPKENIHIYFSPRYIGQFGTTIAQSTDLLNYVGGNTGFLFGTKTRFGIDLGLFNVTQSATNYKTYLVNIGFGMTHQF